MTSLEIRKSGVRLTLALILGFGVTASASAGEVYSWTTDDGIQSFSNERKQIPTRYKDQAKRRTVGSLQSYDRFTPGPKVTGDDYAKRIQNRLVDLRERADRQEMRMARVSQPASSRAASSDVTVDWRQNNSRGSSLGFGVPLGRAASGDGEGILHVQDVRLPRSGSDMTTHHAQIVRRGGKVVAVFEAERNDSPLP
jgi:hypothetical protein